MLPLSQRTGKPLSSSVESGCTQMTSLQACTTAPTTCPERGNSVTIN